MNADDFKPTGIPLLLDLRIVGSSEVVQPVVPGMKRRTSVCVEGIAAIIATMSRGLREFFTAEWPQWLWHTWRLP